MTAELICISTNDVSDEELKQCAQYLAKELFDMGIDIGENYSFISEPSQLEEQLELSRERSNIVFTLGSLDNSNGGFAIETIAKNLSLTFEEHTIGTKTLLLPNRCIVFKGDNSCFPGCAFAAGSQLFVALPSRASELVSMFNGKARQFLEKFSPGTVSTHIFELNNISADDAIVKMGELAASKNPEIRIKEDGSKVVLTLTAKASKRSDGKKLIDDMREQLNKVFAEEIKSDAPQSVQQAVVELLMRKSLTIATAESCTAGLISKCLTEIPGSSAVFLCGVAAYTGEIKHNILGVKRSTLEKYGEVSPEVAAAMAIGARNISGATLGIGVTGIAGPDGGTPEKPVGLVYFALADSGRVWIKKLKAAPGRDRDYIRTLAANSTLELVRLYLASLPEVLNGSISYTSYKTDPAFVDAITPEQKNAPQSSNDEIERVVVDYDSYADEQPVAAAAPLAYIPNDSSDSDYLPADPDDEYGSDFDDEYDDKRDKRLHRIVGFLITVFVLLAISVAAMLMMPQIQSWVANEAAETSSAVVEENVELFDMPESSVFLNYKDNVKAVLYLGDEEKTPIVYSDEAGYYELNGIDKKPNKNGAMHFYFKTDNPSIDRAVLIQSKQSKLSQYESIDFLKEHPVIHMDTRDRMGSFAVFGVGYIDNFTLKRTLKNSSENLPKGLVDELQKRSIVTTDVVISQDDSILIITTDNDTYPNNRLFIVAKRMKSLDTAASADGIKENKDAKLPEKTAPVINNVSSAPVSSSSEPSSEPQPESSEEESSEPASSSKAPSSKPASSSSSAPSSSSKASSSKPASSKASSKPSSSKTPSSKASSETPSEPSSPETSAVSDPEN